MTRASPVPVGPSRPGLPRSRRSFSRPATTPARSASGTSLPWPMAPPSDPLTAGPSARASSATTASSTPSPINSLPSSSSITATFPLPPTRTTTSARPSSTRPSSSSATRPPLPTNPFFLYVCVRGLPLAPPGPSGVPRQVPREVRPGLGCHSRSVVPASARARHRPTEGTQLAPRNNGVPAWDEHSGDEQRVRARLQEAFAAMLDHMDHQIGRLAVLPRGDRPARQHPLRRRLR